MAILDKQLQFSNGQVLTVSAASTNIVDLGPVGVGGYSIGSPSGEWDIHINIPVTFTAGGAATLTISIQTDNDVAFGSPTTLVTYPAISVDDMAAGDRILPLRVPYRAERYVRLYYTVATGPFTAGAITATGGGPVGTNIGY